MAVGKQPSRAFTRTARGIANVLTSDVQIAPAHDRTKVGSLPYKHYTGIWDTGATNTVITQRVCDECNLKPIGMVSVNHAGGTSLRPTYFVNIRLLSKVEIPHVRVTGGANLPGCDVLIGMDIITLGDFAVTNEKGQTSFSFVTPPRKRIDFVAQVDAEQSMGVPKVSRNAKCPCGSGKKYKKCHGK